MMATMMKGMMKVAVMMRMMAKVMMSKGARRVMVYHVTARPKALPNRISIKLQMLSCQVKKKNKKVQMILKSRCISAWKTMKIPKVCISIDSVFQAHCCVLSGKFL